MSVAQSTRSPWLTLVALCLGFFLMLLDSTIVAVALPTIAADLGATAAAAVWINSGYLFAYAVPLLFSGRLGDRFGPRRVYTIGLVVFIVSSLACGLSSSILTLTLARIAQGLGAALMTPQSLSILRRAFTSDRLPQALGIWGGVGGVAAASGPLLGGVLVNLAGWPAVFLVNVPLGLLALGMVAWWVPKLATGTPSRIPAFTSIASAVGVFAVIFAIHEASEIGVAWIALCVAGLVIFTLAFIFQPRDPRQALIPGLLLRSRGFTTATVGATSASFIVGAALIPVMLYLQTEGGLSVVESTLILLPMGIVSAISAPLSGALVGRFGARPVATTGSLAMTASILMCAWLATNNGASLGFAVALGIFGFANSFMWSPYSSAAMTSIEVDYSGAASGAYNFARQVGAVLGSALTAAIVSASGPIAALWMLGATGMIAVIASVLLPKKAGRARAELPQK